MQGQKEAKESNKSNRAWLVLSILAMLVTLCISIASLVKMVGSLDTLKPRKPNAVDEILTTILNQRDAYNIIPTRYAVDPNFYLPPSDQMQRGTCWIFATLFLLESQYRENGIRKGFLKPNQYVSFSKQAYGAWLGEQCMAHPEAHICHHGAYGHAENNTNDQLADSIYYFAKAFPELKKALLPEKVCPYIGTQDPSTDFKCPGMYEAIAKNPIEFKIKSIDFAATINETKKLLFKAKRPLGLGIPIGKTDYYAPCDESSYSNTKQCTDKTTRCPAGYNSEFCYKLSLDGRTKDGSFTYVNDYNRTQVYGEHEMNVVGYNDEWVYLSRFADAKSLGNLKGGFILHNSWRSQGHSVEYLMGRRSEENEAVICPNHQNPTSWIPVNRSCLIENEWDISKCPSKTKMVRGKGIASQPDMLKCIDSKQLYCNPSYKYTLAFSKGDSEFNVNHLFSGLDTFNLIEWDENGKGREITFDKLPFHELGRAFQPVTIVPNNENDCGYYMFPYDALAMIQRRHWSLLDYFHTSDVEFEFSDSSYAANKASGKDYTLLEQSTFTWDKTPFDGPLPYNYVY